MDTQLCIFSFRISYTCESTVPIHLLTTSECSNHEYDIEHAELWWQPRTRHQTWWALVATMNTTHHFIIATKQTSLIQRTRCHPIWPFDTLFSDIQFCTIMITIYHFIISFVQNTLFCRNKQNFKSYNLFVVCFKLLLVLLKERWCHNDELAIGVNP